MNITSIILFLIIFFMIIIQICFRENYSIIDQKKFRKNLVDYYSKKYIDAPSDGNDIKCKLFNNRKKNGLYVKLENKKICEGFAPIESSEIHEKVKKCELVNNISIGNDWKASDWRTRLSRIPKDTIEISDRLGNKKKAGCGFCYDNKKVLFGDDHGPFDSTFSPAICDNWIKPGEDEKNKQPGGTIHKKNIFAKSYPFPDDVNSGGLKGIYKDSVKIHEQELCSKMKNCSDQKHKHADGTSLCGWCAFGRLGDGYGVGMVRKGGSGSEQNETKYSDDYCLWPRELDENRKKTKHWGQTLKGTIEKSKEFKKWTDKKENKKVNNPGKLMNGKKHCDAANEFFPCFPNFTGKISVDGADPKHSDECYDSLWKEYAIYTPNDGEVTTCSGKIKERVKKFLPNSQTFPLWNRTYIPSVENAISEIPKRAKEGKQYNKANPNSIEDPAVQMMFSANQNHLACLNEEANPCDDRFRDRDYGYPRPKNCIDDILTTAKLKEGFSLSGTKAEYQPDNPDTHKYYWPVHNIPGVKDNIHYDMTNAEFKKSVEDDMNYYKDNINNIKTNSSSIPVNELRNKYDSLLVKSYILFGGLRKEAGKEELIFWKDNLGGMDSVFPWVKLCWEDFRKFMEETYPKQVQIKKNGKLMIKKRIENTICKSFVDPNKSSCCTDTDLIKCKGSVLTEKTVTGESPFILEKISTDTFITKAIYERKLFPFWRVLPKQYFVESEWQRILAKKKYDGIPFKGSVNIGDKSWKFGWDTGNEVLGSGNRALYATLNKSGYNTVKVNIIYNKTSGGKDYYNVMYGDKYLVNTGYARNNTYAWVEKTCPSKCTRCRGGTCKQYCSTWNWCGASEAHITGGSGGTNCLGCDVDKRSLFELDPLNDSTDTALRFYLKQSGKYVVHDGRASNRKNGITYTNKGNNSSEGIIFSS